ncbi:MAG: hypothetical protein M1352_02970 [Patescibacteria group bacterium]|nr:hypothetical protein [Patescibacteria group bacterium]
MKRLKFTFLLLAAVFLLAAAFTYPVVLNPSKIVFGYSGDNFGNIWYFWWQKYALTHHLKSSYTAFYNAPVGQKIGSSVEEIIWMLPGSILTDLLNEVLAFNILIFLGFILSFFSMYLLTYYLTRRRDASFLTGIIYAFAPYHYWQASSHLSLSFTFWLPVFVLSLFYFDRNRNLKSAVFLAASFLFTLYTTFYYGYFAALTAIAFFVYKGILDFRKYINLKTFSMLLISALLVGLGSWPLLKGLVAPQTAEDNTGIALAFNRQLDELVGLSARPWDYLIYPPNQAVFGRFNKEIYDFIQSKGSDFKVRSAYLPERVIFLGLVNVFLAAAAVFFLFRRNKYVPITFFLATAAFVVSLPPYFPIHGLNFYTPSYFLYRFFPFIRVYARLGVLVLLFVSLLSGLAAANLLQRISNRYFRVLTFFILVFLVLFEFWPSPSAYTDLRRIPPVYKWLINQPGNPIVAEYPKEFDLQSGLIFQRVHEKELFNMPSSDTRYKIWDEVENLADPKAAAVLKEQGISYVIYHLTDLTPNPYDDYRFFRFAKAPTLTLETQIEMAGFKPVSRFPEAIVYEVL